MPTDREFLVNAIAGTTAATGAATPKDEARKALKVGRVQARIDPYQNTRASNVTALPLLTVPSTAFSNGIQVTSFRVVPMTNLTADNTNAVIFNLNVGDGAGGALTTICTANTAATAAGGLGNLTKAIAYTVTANTSLVNVNANSTLVIDLLNAGTSAAGQQAAGMLFELTYEVL